MRLHSIMLVFGWFWKSPWSHSATLDGALLNGLLHAGHTPEEPGDAEADAGKEAARKGCWEQAVECFEKAAELGSAMGLSRLADCSR